MTNQQVAQAFAEQSKHKGSNSQGNLYFFGDSIYSYSENFVIARLHQTKRTAHVTTKKVSQTTSKQTNLVRRELEKLNYKIIDL